MKNWPGHNAATSAQLLKILTALRSGDSQLFPSERVLIVACEFWAAAMNRELFEYLGDAAEFVLRDAREAFAEMGLMNIVAILDDATRALTRTAELAAAKAVATRLEMRLRTLQQPVDDWIGKYATEHM